MLFELKGQKLTPSLNIRGLDLIRVTKDGMSNIDPFYSTLRPNKMTANAMQAMLLYGRSHYCIFDGYLCLLHNYNEKLSLLTLPFNEKGFMPLSKVLNFMRDYEIGEILWVLDSYFRDMDKALGVLEDYFAVKKLAVEYVYNLDRLCAMEGSEFRRMRKKVRHFEREYPFVHYRWCTASDKDIIDKVYSEWCSRSEEKGKRIHDKTYMSTIFDWIPDKFLLFMDGDKPIGFMNYATVNKSLVYISSRKLDTSYQYISQYVEHIMALTLSGMGYKFANRDAAEGDYAKHNSSLDEFKRSFCPEYELQRYGLRLRGD